MKFEWEVIHSTPSKKFPEEIYDRTVRAKVKGGWLVRYLFPDGNVLTFIPDEHHSWSVE